MINTVTEIIGLTSSFNEFSMSHPGLFPQRANTDAIYVFKADQWFSIALQISAELLNIVSGLSMFWSFLTSVSSSHLSSIFFRFSL
jgi:hypothetical protein